ncbi:4-hydroxy-tetrahydrodipicolinate reductase [Nocardioides daedukensis]|uniref:4-hydroxy-tetrahydrodipicolinate reductase n=1 Tax=Nocardioides daedukensis TaxID=634462 RepID=A0A7Y9S3X0_9ACTN|nr:diacylglycerol kinase [Nocardioides daedukensis]NYG58955.1 4-hydroxy-tetrahydrodipicolinate reductase [Nocardioides daedukensis]
MSTHATAASSQNDATGDPRKLRVVGWSTGTVGRHVIVGVDRHPDLELVGLWVSNPDKAGKDAGELAGLGRELGVTATNDRDALLALKPDAIIHTAMTDDRIFESIEDLKSFLNAGVNVVSSGPVLLQYPYGVLWEDGLREVEEACTRGNASIHVNGIDPGFANDVLPLVMTSLSQRIDQVKVSEIADYSTYYQPVVMRDIFGFGKAVDDEEPMLWKPGILSMGWGSVVRQIAAGLGLTLDEPLVESVDRRPAPVDTKTVSVDIEAGAMGAVKFQVIGRVDGVDRVVLEHVTRTAEDQVPEWPTPPDGGGCYRVEITGEPNMKVDFTHCGENGDHNDSGMITTAQRLVNSVSSVVAAESGIVTALDLFHVTGRGLVSSKETN